MSQPRFAEMFAKSNSMKSPSSSIRAKGPSCPSHHWRFSSASERTSGRGWGNAGHGRKHGRECLKANYIHKIKVI